MPTILALHIIFVVTWFAGLFYIVRLFVYHAEADKKSEPERSILIAHFKLAQKRLWYGITWPSAIGTTIFGLWLLYGMYGFNIPDWLYLKLFFVLGLMVYHLLCGRIFNQFQKDKINFSGMKMRLWNEVATVFLVSIIFIVELKDMLNWMKGVLGLMIFSAVLIFAIRIYKKMRESK
jgi:putative membrane protein